MKIDHRQNKAWLKWFFGKFNVWFQTVFRSFSSNSKIFKYIRLRKPSVSVYLWSKSYLTKHDCHRDWKLSYQSKHKQHITIRHKPDMMNSTLPPSLTHSLRSLAPSQTSNLKLIFHLFSYHEISFLWRHSA